MHKIVLHQLQELMRKRFDAAYPNLDEEYDGTWVHYPDQRIGTDADPYLDRWFVVPKNDWPFGWMKRAAVKLKLPLKWQGAVAKFADSFCINIYLHHFHRSDDDRALHDHPWYFNASWILDGAYDEITFAKGSEPYIMPTSKRYEHRTRMSADFTNTPRREGEFKFRWGPSPHRVLLHTQYMRGNYKRPIPAGEKKVWTLFIMGPYRATWGFYCDDERRWIQWKPFMDHGCAAPDVD